MVFPNPVSWAMQLEPPSPHHERYALAVFLFRVFVNRPTIPLLASYAVTVVV